MDKHHYALIVRTGYDRNAGTDCEIKFVFDGDASSSNIRTLYDGYRDQLTRSSTVHYHTTTQKKLGEVKNLKIWITPKIYSKYSSWFLEEILLVDLENMERYHFFAHILLNKSIPCVGIPKSENDQITAF